MLAKFVHYCMVLSCYNKHRAGQCRVPLLGELAEKLIGWKVHIMTSYLVLMTFFYQLDQSNATSIEKVCGPQEGRIWNINFIWSHSTRESWSTYTRHLFYSFCINFILEVRFQSVISICLPTHKNSILREKIFPNPWRINFCLFLFQGTLCSSIFKLF